VEVESEQAWLTGDERGIRHSGPRHVGPLRRLYSLRESHCILVSVHCTPHPFACMYTTTCA